MLCFSEFPQQKIQGFQFQFLDSKCLVQHFDSSIIPEAFGGKCQRFPNLLSSLNKKITSEDYLLHFDEMIKELQTLEVEKKRKVFLFN